MLVKKTKNFYCSKCKNEQTSSTYWIEHKRKFRIWCRYCGKVLSESKKKSVIKYCSKCRTALSFNNTTGMCRFHNLQKYNQIKMGYKKI